MTRHYAARALAAFLAVAGMGIGTAIARTSAPAIADGAAGALTATPVQDCSSGCTIMTCDGNVCTVWYCSGKGGCVVQGRFIKQFGAQDAGAAGAPPRVDDTALVKTCQTDTLCNLYALKGSKATLVGTYDNIDGAARQYLDHTK